MPVSKPDTRSRGWLVGIPKKKAPDLWWKFVFWPDAVAKDDLSTRTASEGMYCPQCGKGQPFFDRCLYCGCVFSCFILIDGTADSTDNPLSGGTASRGVAKRSQGRGILARLDSLSLKARMITAVVTVLVLLALVVGVVRQRMSVRSQYAHNFVQALYGIKSGMNLGKMVCEGTYNDWRGVESASREMDPQALADLETVRTETAKILRDMGSPPAGYEPSARILQRMYANYEKTNSLIIGSPENPSQHASATVATEEEFLRDIPALKANMPAPLVKEIAQSSRKYDLSFMAMK